MRTARSHGSALVTSAVVTSAVALVLATAGGCGGDEASTDESGEAVSEVAPVPVVEPPPAPPPDRNRDGSLIPSDVVVAGLTLPRGLREVAFHERQHYYEGPYPPEAYVAYFGPRLLTGNVQTLPAGGARYVEATAREARGGVAVIDVLISPGAPGTTIVTIDERPPVPERPPSEAEVLEDLRRALEREE